MTNLSLATHCAIVIVVFFGCILVVRQSHQYSQTFDEPLHIARGMRLLHTGTYPYVHHPPLAPILFAIGPTFSGVTYQDGGNKWRDGELVLRQSHLATLRLARLGNLPFYIVACLATYACAVKLRGPKFGLLAATLFAMNPTVVGHASLATTDMAATALFALWCFEMIWGDSSRTSQRIVMGLLSGLLLTAKYSALVFGGCAWLFLIPFGFQKRRFIPPVLSIFVCAMTVWCIYGFSWSNLESACSRCDRRVEKLVGEELFSAVANVPIPAPEFVLGVLSVGRQDQEGQFSMFMGKNRPSHFFFPVLLLAKSPVCFLLCLAVGTSFTIRRRRPYEITILIVMLCILGSAIASQINLGLRHILPAFPWLSILATVGVRQLAGSPRVRPVLFALVLGLAFELSLVEDSIAHFNFVAESAANWITTDSDLDWGQDLIRLKNKVESLEIDQLNVAYHGTANVSHYLGQNWTPYDGKRNATGWIAVSVYKLMNDAKHSWLADKPFIKVGSSIRLIKLTNSANEATKVDLRR